MKVERRWACACAIAAFLLLLTGCGAGGGGGDAPARPATEVVSSLTISPSTATLVAGSTIVLSATASNLSAGTLVWTASAGTVTASGTTATYLAPATPGTYTVTVTSPDGKLSASATITVTAAPSPGGSPTIELVPSAATISTGATLTLNATITGTSDTSVTWTTTSGTISGSGTTVTFTAPATPGRVTITATIAGGSATATASITVTSPPVQTISISPSVLAMTVGSTTTFTATLGGTTGASVIWSASGGTVVASGTSVEYTAPNLPGTYTVTARLADGSASASVTVTVTSAPPPPPAVTVTVSPPSASITTAMTLSLTATVSGTTNPVVQWSVTSGSITGTGATVTYNPPATPGTYTVVAAVGTASATATITVTSAPVSPVGIVLQNPASSTMLGGSSQSFTANVSGSSDTAVIWSATPAGGTFTGGTAATVTYTAPGRAATYTITATAHAASSKTASTTITVPAPVVTVSPASGSVNGGATQGFTASVSNTQITAVTWTVSGGTITPNGLTATFTAPVTPGSYTVRATSTADSSSSGTAAVTVPAPTVTVSPSTPTIGAGTQVSLTASVTGTTNKSVTWTASSGTLSATTGSTISYTAPNQRGTYTVTATSAAVPTQKATATITVDLSVTLSPATATVNAGGSVGITATLVGAGSVTWTSSGGTVNGSGLSVNYLAPGTAGSYTVTATSTLDGATSGSATMTVVTPPPDATPPSAPTNLTAATISSTQINLSWSAATDNVGVVGYKIYRGASQVGTTASLVYYDLGLAASTTYTYKVSAYDAVGNESEQSSPASATTSPIGWVPPIGIPTPSFGVNEVAPTPPSPWNSALAGYYYVDTTGTYGSCNDSNTYGYPAAGKARCTVPDTLGAGSYVEVHGTQNYTLDFSWHGTSGNWVANSSGPVWVRGQTYATRPILRTWGTTNSTYVIIENVNFQARNATDNDYGIAFAQGANNHHLALRNSEVSGGNTSSTQNGSAVGVGEWSYNSGSNIVHDIVIDNVNFHDVGAVSASADVDDHCIAINGKANNVWITHNTFARCGGDSLQVEAQDGHKTNIHHIYFGKNTSTNNRQSGGWVKNAQDVIFSQNDADTFAANSGGPGACYGSQYDHDYVWYLFNSCHDATTGVDLAADNGATSNVYLIGNVMWHIGAGNSFQPYNVCTFVLRQHTTLYVVNNSVYDYVGGMCAPPGPVAVVAVNNIFQYRNNSGGYEWYDEGGLSWTLSNNIFYNNGGALATTTSWSSCANCKNQNPLFVNTTTPDMHLQTSPVLSPAVDAGIVSGVYTTFQNRYGIDIRKDFAGTTRPLGTVWDMGAYETQ